MNTVFFLNWDQLATDSSLKEVFAKNERGYRLTAKIVHINYMRMRRKIIDNFRLKYLNNLFEIKLIILRYDSYIATF